MTANISLQLTFDLPPAFLPKNVRRLKHLSIVMLIGWPLGYEFPDGSMSSPNMILCPSGVATPNSRKPQGLSDIV